MVAVSPSARIRGIYATAVTRLLLDDGIDVVDASATLVDRFEGTFEAGPPNVSIRSTDNRQGVAVTGDPDAVDRVAELLAAVSRDTFRWDAVLPRSAVATGRVERTGESGAVVDLGEASGFLPFGESNDYLEVDDHVAVQVIDPEPPWSAGRRPVLSQIPRVPGTYLELIRDPDQKKISAPTVELYGLVELLSPDLPDGWGVEVAATAEDATLPRLEAELERAVERAETVEDTISWARTASETPTALERLEATVWCRFGREGRFALDDHRAAVTPTMEGHHRVKAGGQRAATAVDFLERIAGAGQSFDADAVFDTFGPAAGDRVRIEHGKPDGRAIDLGRGEVTERPNPGTVVIHRELSAEGTLDAIDVPKEAGDVAETTFVEGQWWYATVYRDAEGDPKGTYVNVGTPLEVFPHRVRYIDLYVDVVRGPEGEVRTVDADELADAEAEGLVSEALAVKARDVAAAIERSFS